MDKEHEEMKFSGVLQPMELAVDSGAIPTTQTELDEFDMDLGYLNSVRGSRDPFLFNVGTVRWGDRSTGEEHVKAENVSFLIWEHVLRGDTRINLSKTFWTTNGWQNYNERMKLGVVLKGDGGVPLLTWVNPFPHFSVSCQDGPRASRPSAESESLLNVWPITKTVQLLDTSFRVSRC